MDVTVHLNLLLKSTKTTLQPDDVIASSRPASVCVTNADDEELCHRPSKKTQLGKAPAIEG